MNKLFLSSLILALGCSTEGSVGHDTANFAGTYSVSVTNGRNSCTDSNWREGEGAMNIPLTIVQTGSSVSVTVDGWWGGLVALGHGTREFMGTVTGNRIRAILYSRTSRRTGGCAYVINGTMEATLTGNGLEGRVLYQPAAGNMSPDCPVCASEQPFSGHRQPVLQAGRD